MNLITIGGGTNSLAMIIEMHNRNIPIDVVLFADTVAERPETYESIKRTDQWLKEKGYCGVTIVTHINTLEDDCIRRKALPSIAYGGFKTCSQRFKLGPQNKFCNNHEPFKKIWKEGGKVNKYIGYDFGEERRVENALKYNRLDKKYNYFYPLVDWEIDREGCIEIIEKEGLPQPGKSSCFFCPNMKKPEILKLSKDHPNLIKRALFLEENAELTKIKGLGRSWSWTQFLEGSKNQIVFEETFDDVSNIPCDCYDG